MGKEEVNASLFEDDLILCIKDIKNPPGKITADM